VVFPLGTIHTAPDVLVQQPIVQATTTATTELDRAMQATLAQLANPVAVAAVAAVQYVCACVCLYKHVL
jgi:hypothetical protein